MRFPESALAHELLDGLVGVEIGAAAHNPFGLPTWNVDLFAPGTERRALYDEEQRVFCGEAAPVDVVAAGDVLPFVDQGLDYIVASHVIEHFWDPIAALDEWVRVARRYLFIICPQRHALAADVDLPLTTLDEVRRRHRDPASRRPTSDRHHTRWTSAGFHRMCEAAGHQVIAVEDPDTKAGNGFTIVIDTSVPTWRVRLGTARRRVRRAPTIVRRRLAGARS